MKPSRLIIIIAVIVAISIYMVLPNNPGFFGREITTHLGLDLVGGAQVLLEADLPEDVEITSDQMETARAIIEDRVNGMAGVGEGVVQRAGDRFIVVEIPGAQDPETAVATIKETALLEFVDFSELTSSQAALLLGMRIDTDYAGSGAAEVITGTETTLPDFAQRTFHTVMTGDIIEDAGVIPNELGQPEVSFVLTSEGSDLFEEFTSTHIGKVLAITLDKVVISVPTINDAIRDQGSISGSFTREEANKLAVQLRYGRLPVPLKVAENRSISPSLGDDSLEKSLIAGLVGISIVMLFMALYYRLPGILADIAIIIYALILFALFRFIPVTLTLPGIAGLMLSTGSALDANILIFERMKEELRGGRTLKQAVSLGWERALPSIRDANIATIITCLILFWFGNAFGATIVKGFSVTLLVGVFVSLFTSLVVTRTFLSLVIGWIKNIDLETWFGI